MPAPPLAAVILAAGLGTRMKSALPKVLHPLAGRPMLLHLTASLVPLAPARLIVVTAPAMQAVADAVPAARAVVQQPALGTGHAVLAARGELAGFGGDVLILYGDTPLLGPETMQAMLAMRRRGMSVVVLGFRPQDPGAYGRLVVDDAGGLSRIVEFKDASPAEQAIDLCNSGVMAVDGAVLLDLLDQVGCDNAKREYYLTDIVGIACGRGLACGYVEADPEELLGINSRAELAAAEAIVQRRLRQKAMAEGATLLDPESTYFSYDTKLGRDVTIEPNVFFGPGVSVGDGVRIRAYSHLEGANVAAGAIIGPFARLRPGTGIGEGAHIGNFVEVKAASIEAGAKVNHLTYIGDARVGAGANVGAGTITCNYDGFGKYHTDIGAGAFIGSNSALVAPVKIGDGAIVGAGSTIARDVPAGAMAVTRADQQSVQGGAERFRSKAKARAEKAKPAKQKD